MSRPSAFRMPSTSVRKTRRSAPSAAERAPAAASALTFSSCPGSSALRAMGATTGTQARASERLDEANVGLQRAGDESQFRVRDRSAQQAAVRAGDADGVHARASQVGDKALVDEAGERGDGDVQARRVRHAQAADELGAEAEFRHPRGDRRAAAVRDDRAGPLALEGGDVGERRVVRAKRAAADLDDDDGAFGLHRFRSCTRC